MGDTHIDPFFFLHQFLDVHVLGPHALGAIPAEGTRVFSLPVEDCFEAGLADGLPAAIAHSGAGLAEALKTDLANKVALHN